MGDDDLICFDTGGPCIGFLVGLAGCMQKSFPEFGKKLLFERLTDMERDMQGLSGMGKIFAGIPMRYSTTVKGMVMVSPPPVILILYSPGLVFPPIFQVQETRPEPSLTCSSSPSALEAPEL